MEIKGRLEYIDALRGLAIFLVVYCHVASISLGIPEGIGSTNDTVSLLHLPLFFFLSGVLMFRKDRFLQMDTSGKYVTRKVGELVIPALIFVTLFALWMHRSAESILFSQFKGGYWFTFFLFLFILIYALFSLILRRFEARTRATVIMALGACIGFAPTMTDIFFPQLTETLLFRLLSYQNFKYFLFFTFGAWIRSRFEEFINWGESENGRLILVAIPFVAFILLHFHIPRIQVLVEWAFSLSSILLLTIIFRESDGTLGKHKAGQAITYIGRRSLDIYFLHFFLLPQLLGLGSSFAEGGMIVLELCTISVIALLIICICLVISWLIRRSDFLARLLFGKADPHENTNT